MEIKRVSLEQLSGEAATLFSSARDYCQSDFCLLQEELWGVENGVYVPIGRVELPTAIQYDIGGNPSEYRFGLLSIFTNEFLETGETLRVKNPRGDWMFDYYNVDKLEYIDSGSEDIGRRPMDIAREHIGKFIQLYDQNKSRGAASEAVRCIRRCFTDYRG